MEIRFLIVLFLWCGKVFSQQNVFEIIDKKPLQADALVGVDSYGDIFFVQENTLYKQLADGMYNFKDFQLGKIGQVDILNPLKIIVFYPDVQTVVVLDNKLSEIQRVNFAMTPPFLNVLGASAANDNRIWIFNQDSQQLELYNYINKSHQVLSGPVAERYVMQKSNFNFCYVLTDKSLRVYNIYGSLIQQLENTGIEKFDINQNQVALWVNGEAVLLTADNQMMVYNFQDIHVKDLYLTNDFLYIYDGKFLYKTKLILN